MLSNSGVCHSKKVKERSLYQALVTKLEKLGCTYLALKLSGDAGHYYTPSNKENSPRNVTPQVTRKIVYAMNECNEFTGKGKRLITEITTPDFF